VFRLKSALGFGLGFWPEFGIGVAARSRGALSFCLIFAASTKPVVALFCFRRSALRGAQDFLPGIVGAGSTEPLGGGGVV